MVHTTAMWFPDYGKLHTNANNDSYRHTHLCLTWAVPGLHGRDLSHSLLCTRLVSTVSAERSDRDPHILLLFISLCSPLLRTFSSQSYCSIFFFCFTRFSSLPPCSPHLTDAFDHAVMLAPFACATFIFLPYFRIFLLLVSFLPVFPLSFPVCLTFLAYNGWITAVYLALFLYLYLWLYLHLTSFYYFLLFPRLFCLLFCSPFSFMFFVSFLTLSVFPTLSCFFLEPLTIFLPSSLPPFSPLWAPRLPRLGLIPSQTFLRDSSPFLLPLPSRALTSALFCILLPLAWL